MDTNEAINMINDPIENGKKPINAGTVIAIIIGLIALCIFLIAYNMEQKKEKGEEFLSLLTKDQYIIEMIKGDGEFFKDGEVNYKIFSYNGCTSDSGRAANEITLNEERSTKHSISVVNILKDFFIFLPHFLIFP